MIIGQSSPHSHCNTMLIFFPLLQCQCHVILDEAVRLLIVLSTFTKHNKVLNCVKQWDSCL